MIYRSLHFIVFLLSYYLYIFIFGPSTNIIELGRVSLCEPIEFDRERAWPGSTNLLPQILLLDLLGINYQSTPNWKNIS